VNVLDADGIKIGARMVNVQLEADHMSPDGLKHLPDKINICLFHGFTVHIESLHPLSKFSSFVAF